MVQLMLIHVALLALQLQRVSKRRGVRVHATAGVYNSLDVEQTSAAVEGQTQEHVRGQPGLPGLAADCMARIL